MIKNLEFNPENVKLIANTLSVSVSKVLNDFGNFEDIYNQFKKAKEEFENTMYFMLGDKFNTKSIIKIEKITYDRGFEAIGSCYYDYNTSSRYHYSDSLYSIKQKLENRTLIKFDSEKMKEFEDSFDKIKLECYKELEELKNKQKERFDYLFNITIDKNKGDVK